MNYPEKTLDIYVFKAEVIIKYGQSSIDRYRAGDY